MLHDAFFWLFLGENALLVIGANIIVWKLRRMLNPKPLTFNWEPSESKPGSLRERMQK